MRELCQHVNVDPNISYPSKTIEWRKADPSYGPDEDGWAIVNGSADYGGADTYTNIAYCPWCGKKLPKKGPPCQSLLADP